MKCLNCGSECKENQKFCSECGHKIEVIEEIDENNSIDDIASGDKQPPNKKRKKIAIIGSLLVVAIFCISSLFYFWISRNNDNKISIEFTEKMFSYDIKNAWEFNFNKKYILSYYNYLIEAYNKSDGVRCKTFKLPKEFDFADSMLDEYKMNFNSTFGYMHKGDYSKFIIIKQLSNTKSVVAAINLVKASNPNSGEKELNELRTSIINAYATFTSPVDYSKSKIPIYD